MNKATDQRAGSVPLFDETLAVMNELAVIMAEEIALLAKQDHKAHQELMLRKNKLVIAHQANVKTLMKQPALLTKASASVRANLKATGTKLAQVSERNALALRTAAQCSQRLIDHIIKHVKEEALPKQGYSDPRKDRLMLGSYSPVCPSIAVTRTA